MNRAVFTTVVSLFIAAGAASGPVLAQEVGGPPPETEGACGEAGGRWDRGGLGGQYTCFVPTPDAGKACQAAEDCSGFCLVETGAETGTCSPETPMFGCFAYVDLDGAEVTLCID